VSARFAPPIDAAPGTRCEFLIVIDDWLLNFLGAPRGFELSEFLQPCRCLLAGFRFGFSGAVSRVPCLRQQHLDAQSVVAALAMPASRGRARIYMYAAIGMIERQLCPIAALRRDTAVDCRAVEFHEAHGAVVQHLNFNAAFVDLTMMEAAQAHEVRWFRLAAIRPVLNMMSISVASIRTPWKATAFISRLEKTSQLRRNRSCLATDVERFAFLVFDQRDHARITR
jgi:uncharacterized protein YkvS